MNPTLDWLEDANKVIRRELTRLRPKLLEAHGAIEHRLKDDKSVVTEMDMLVEGRLKEVLGQFDSSVAFGGEETGIDFNQETFWMVDPIDSTESFIRGLPFATNLVTLMHKGQPIMSVIHNFTLGDYYLAIKDHGATRNGHKIKVSDRPINRAMVILSATAGKPHVAGLYDKLGEKVAAMRRFGGAGYDFATVASGGMDARIQFNGKGCEWDFAPGALLVQEAGGRVANIGTGTYDFRNFNHIAASPAVFDEIMNFMVTQTH